MFTTNPAIVSTLKLHKFWESLTSEEKSTMFLETEGKQDTVKAIFMNLLTLAQNDFNKIESENKPESEKYHSRKQLLLRIRTLSLLMGILVPEQHYVLTSKPLILQEPSLQTNIHDLINLLPKAFRKNELLINIIHIINRVIDYGNHERIWEYPLVNNLYEVPKKKNPIGTQAEWQTSLYAMELYRQHSQFVQSIPSNAMVQDECLGMLLVDLMFESFVINKNRLIMLLKSLSEKDHYHYQNGRLFFYVPADDFNEPTRVFISPQTETLIYQYAPCEYIQQLSEAKVHTHTFNTHNTVEDGFYRKSKDKLFHSALMKALKRYIKTLELPWHLMPTSIFGWCRFAEKGLYEKLPPILINYYSGTMQAYSLGTKSQEKLFACTPHDNTIQYDQKVERTSEPSRNTSYGLRQVRILFNHKSRKQNPHKLLAKIQEGSNQLTTLPINTDLIKQWGLSQLFLSDKKHFAVSPIKILSRIDSIARHIIGIFENDSLLEINAEQRAELFLDVIDKAVSSRNRNTIQSNLRSFNVWLEKTYNIAKIIDKSEIFGDPKLTDKTVNSNLITFDEYEWVRGHLNSLIAESEGIDQERFEMMYLMLILGFRCGLRSMEVFKLKLSDYIPCETSPQLIIRESYDRELKTKNAKRTFDLIALLDPEELQVVRKRFALVNERLQSLPKKQQKAENTYLFSGHDRLTRTVAIQSIKTPLMGMLHHACKDDRLTFHHLRHSFASWHFLSFCIAELDLDIKNYFKAFSATQKWLLQAKQRKNQLLPTSMKSRKGLFWITIKMGHESFKTTFEHYIHTADIVSLLMQDRFAKSYTAEFWSKLSGANPNYLAKQKDNREVYASKYAAPKYFKEVYKAQLLSFENYSFNHDIELPRPAKYTHLNETWHSKMLEYQAIKTVETEKLLNSDQRKVARLFKNHPKFRLRSLQKTELALFNQLSEQITETFSIDLNDKQTFTKDFKSLLRTFGRCLVPESANTTTLKPQRSYRLLTTSPKQARILTSGLEALKIPYQLHLQMNKEQTKADIEKNKDALKIWSGHLKQKQNTFILHKSYLKATGTHARLEIRPIKQNGKKLHPWFYLLSALCARYDFLK